MRAKAKPFSLSRFSVNYDAVPRVVIATGQIKIEGSPQGNLRPIYARLSLAEAEHLEFQLHASILAVKDGGDV